MPVLYHQNNFCIEVLPFFFLLFSTFLGLGRHKLSFHLLWWISEQVRKWPNTDLFWTERVATLAEVGADGREGHEVSLHVNLLAALGEHLLEGAGKEAAKAKEPWVELMTGSAERSGGDRRADRPEDGHFRRLVQELVHAVHHPGVELDQVHHLGHVGVFPQWERRLVDARVSLAWNNKV